MLGNLLIYRFGQRDYDILTDIFMGTENFQKISVRN